MSKPKQLTIAVESPTGDVYRIKSDMLSRTLYSYINREKPKTLEDAEKMYNEMAEKTNAAWQLKGTEEWHKDGWSDLPPLITGSWLNKLALVSGAPIEAKVESEKN